MCFLRCHYTIAVQSYHSQSVALDLHMLRYFSMGHCVYVTSFHSEHCWAVCVTIHTWSGLRYGLLLTLNCNLC